MSTGTQTRERTRLRKLVARERLRFEETHPRSRALFDETSATLLQGVPMCWMSCWAGGFPVFFRDARGASLTDVDGHTYVDFCLGDSAAMAGHGPKATARAVSDRYARGTTAMLPTDDAAWVGRELGRRFGLDVWQFSLTASDANRWVLRLARALTGRPKVLVFNGCYHGVVDEAVVMLDESGTARARHGNIGPAVDPTTTTEVIEFNDVEALERVLAAEQVACVLTEPVLTNIGIVPPAQGYHDALREITRRTGTLLVIDETHTFSSGPGGYTSAHRLEPDFLTLGKAIGGGIPIGAYGMRRELAERIVAAGFELDDTGAFGSTLAGNALSMAAARATLEHVLTDSAFERMTALCERFADAVEDVLRERAVAWHIVRVGARAEYRFAPEVPRTGGESSANSDLDLDAYMHSYLLNRGVLITPFHNMALMSPDTKAADVDRHTEVFGAAVDELIREEAIEA